MTEKEFKCPKCGSDMKECIPYLKCRNLWCRHILYVEDLIKIIFQERQAKKELVEALEEIPCLCHEVYKARNLRDPECPKCNWIDEKLIKKYKEKNNDQ